MAQVKQRVISREEAIKLVKRMLRKNTQDYVIRDALMDRGFSLHDANDIIQEVRQAEEEDDLKMRISPQIVGIGLAIITVVILIMAVLLYIIPNL